MADIIVEYLFAQSVIEKIKYLTLDSSIDNRKTDEALSWEKQKK